MLTARCFAILHAGSCPALADFFDGRAAEALSSTPQAPGKAERGAAAPETTAC